MSLGKSHTQLHTKHHRFMRILVISNPKLGAGMIRLFVSTNCTVPYDTRNAGLGELFADFSYLDIIWRVV